MNAAIAAYYYARVLKTMIIDTPTVEKPAFRLAFADSAWVWILLLRWPTSCRRCCRAGSTAGPRVSSRACRALRRRLANGGVAGAGDERQRLRRQAFSISSWAWA